MSVLRRFILDRSGATALEFALIGMPLILLLLGLLEFGRGLHIRNAVDAAADRAQRAIMIDPAASLDLLESEIRDGFHAGETERLSVSYASELLSGRNYRVVSLAYEMQILLPMPMGRTITIGSTRRVATSP